MREGGGGGREAIYSVPKIIDNRGHYPSSNRNERELGKSRGDRAASSREEPTRTAGRCISGLPAPPIRRRLGRLGTLPSLYIARTYRFDSLTKTSSTFRRALFLNLDLNYHTYHLNPEHEQTNVYIYGARFILKARGVASLDELRSRFFRLVSANSPPFNFSLALEFARL